MEDNTTTYPGSDYYVIGLKDYTQQMHSDLPKPTRLRGYYQVNGTDHNSQYLGPLFTFSGGYDIPFSTDPYMTTLQGTLTVAGIGGTLIVDRLIIR